MKRILCVTYDLPETASSEDYQSLFEVLKSLGAWWHHLQSTWLIRTDIRPSLIRDKCMKVIPEDSKIFVFAFGKPWAGSGLKRSAYDWIREFEDGEES